MRIILVMFLMLVLCGCAKKHVETSEGVPSEAVLFGTATATTDFATPTVTIFVPCANRVVTSDEESYLCCFNVDTWKFTLGQPQQGCEIKAICIKRENGWEVWEVANEHH